MSPFVRNRLMFLASTAALVSAVAEGADVPSDQADPTASTGTAASAPCVPECRAGFVCVEGKCVSACNPPCADGELCTAARTCVAKAPTPGPALAPTGDRDALAPSTQDYTYERVRFGLGGGLGLAFAPDGTGYPFGFHVALAFPFSQRLYGHVALAGDWFKTSKSDLYPIGGTTYASTYNDSEHLLIAGRLGVGYSFARLFGMRLGPLLGYRSVYWANGSCGGMWQEKEKTGFAVGGTTALTFTTSRSEFALVFDAYTAKNKGYCSRSTTTLKGVTTYNGTMVATDKLDMQLMALGTFLF